MFAVLLLVAVAPVCLAQFNSGTLPLPPICNCQDLKNCKNELTRQKSACAKETVCLEILRLQGVSNPAGVAQCMDQKESAEAELYQCIESRLRAPVGCVNERVANVSPFTRFLRGPRTKRAAQRGGGRRGGQHDRMGDALDDLMDELSEYKQCIMDCVGVEREDDDDGDFERDGMMFMRQKMGLKYACYNQLNCRPEMTREQRRQKWQAKTECKQQLGFTRLDNPNTKLCQCMRSVGVDVDCGM